MRTFTITTALLLFSLGASSARAELTITLTEAGDGGVDLTATGTSIGSVGGDNTAQFRFVYGIFTTDAFWEDLSPSGSYDVDGNNYAVSNATLNSFDGNEGAATIVKFDTPDTVEPTGPVTANSIAASYAVGDLAFSSLTPGTYASTSVAGTTLVVVPEPSSLALLGLGGLALFRRRRRG